MKSLLAILTLICAQWIPLQAMGSVSLPVTGTIKPAQVTSVGSEVSGRVLDVLVSVGSVVEKGQILLKIDPQFFEIELEAQKHALSLAELALEDAKLEFTRMKHLWDKGNDGGASISKKQYDQALSAVKQCQIRKNQALTALEQTQMRFNETLIKAPFAGVITKRFVDPGEAITSMPASPLLEIMDLSSLVFDFAVPQNKLAVVKAGLPIIATVEGVAGEVTGTIHQVFPNVDPSTRSATCRVLLSNDHPDVIKPGCFMSATILLEKEN